MSTFALPIERDRGLKVEVMGSVFDDRTEEKRLKNFLKIVLGN